jgi:hypothetical protein
MKRQLLSPQRITYLLTLAISSLSMGCSLLSVDKSTATSMPVDATSGVQAQVPAVQNVSYNSPVDPQASMFVTIETRADGKKPEIKRLPLRPGMFVQHALEQSGTVDRFRRMDVQVVRNVTGRRAKMDVRYEHGKGSVDPLYDYALHPGDHIVATEDTSNALDDMFSSLLSNPIIR